MINKFLGVDVVIEYLITDNVISAYSWHYHNLHGEIVESEALNKWLLNELQYMCR